MKWNKMKTLIRFKQHSPMFAHKPLWYAVNGDLQYPPLVGFKTKGAVKRWVASRRFSNPVKVQFI
jgi:hypothetical protein